MLKKSKTKFGYARKIFALPLLFALTFIYLVNAKNKEITATNLVISKMVAELKKDTIIPKAQIAQPTVNAYGTTDDAATAGRSEQETAASVTKSDVLAQQPEKPLSLDDLRDAVDAKRKEIEPIRAALNSKEVEGRKLSDDLRQKGEEYRKIAEKKDFDNPKLKVLGDQMDDLGKKIDGIFSSAEYQQKIKQIESKYADMDVLFKKMDQLYAKIDAEYLANHNANIDQRINTTYVDELAKKAEKQAKEVEKLVNSSTFKKQIASAEKAAKAAEKQVNSRAFKQQMEQAKKIAEDTAKQQQAKVIILNSGQKTQPDDMPIIYIDGNQVTEAEMKKFPPEKIEKVMVNKKGYNGNAKSEIWIYTKK